MEQENPFPQNSLHQNSPVQIFPLQNSSNSEATDMVIESLGSEDINFSQLLRACQFKEALSFLEAELCLKRASLGESNIQLVPLLNQMAEVQTALAQYSKVADLSHQSERILQSHRENPQYNSLTSQAYHNLAIISKDAREALVLINKSLSFSPPPDILQNLEKHKIKALILCDLKQYKEALEEIQKSLDIVNDPKSTIIDDIVKARVYNALGDIRSAFSDWHQARRAYEATMEICKKNDLNLHIEMAKACEGLGGTLIKMKKTSDLALKLAESALKIYEKCYGEDPHPAKVSTLLLFARYFKQAKNHSKNKEYITLTVEEGEAFYNEDYEKRRDLRLIAATIVIADLNYQEALATQVLETSREGLNGRELVTLCLQQCEACLICGDSDLLRTIYPETVDAVKDVYGEVSLEMAKLYEKIGKSYKLKRQSKKKIVYLELCILIYKELFGDSHIEIARISLVITGVYAMIKDYSKCIFYVQQALSIQIEFYGEFHPDVVESYIKLGDVYAFNEEFSKAVKTYLEVLKIQEKIDDQNIYQTYEAIAMLYSKLRDEKSSTNCYMKAYQMARMKFGMTDSRTLDMKEWIEWNVEEEDLLANTKESFV